MQDLLCDVRWVHVEADVPVPDIPDMFNESTWSLHIVMHCHSLALHFFKAFHCGLTWSCGRIVARTYGNLRSQLHFLVDFEPKISRSSRPASVSWLIHQTDLNLSKEWEAKQCSAFGSGKWKDLHYTTILNDINTYFVPICNMTCWEPPHPLLANTAGKRRRSGRGRWVQTSGNACNKRGIPGTLNTCSCTFP